MKPVTVFPEERKLGEGRKGRKKVMKEENVKKREQGLRWMRTS